MVGGGLSSIWLLREEGDTQAKVDFGINMTVEWKARNEGRASTDAGVVLGVPSLVSGVDPHSGEEVDVRRVVTGWSV